MKKIYKNFIFDIILAVLFLALGVVLLPFFEIGKTVLDFTVAILLCLYLGFYLSRKFRGGSVYIALTAVEFTLIVLIAVGLVLKQFEVISIGNTCQIIGLVMWLRGVCCLVKGYFTQGAEARRKYSLLMFLGYIILVSAGAFIFAKPIITDAALIWIICISSFALCALFTALAIIFAPKSKEKNKTNK